ncbi:putative tRNA-binding protein [Ilyonectria robusta]
MAAISAQTYTPTEEAEIQQWLTTSDRLKSGDDKSTILETLNNHLSSRATLLGSKPSKADVAIYETLAPIVAQWTPEERTGEKGLPHIVRLVDFVQNSPLFGLDVKDGDKVKVDQDSVLYASEDYTEYEGQICRTVCSGLNGLIPLEEMQGRKVIVVCNLKPVKMRGIKSCAMVLAASPVPKEGEDDHKGPVELVAPPADAKAGERVFFEGFDGKPEGVLNPKKKIWETFQPGFTTTDALEVAFDASVVEQLGKTGISKLVTESGGVCTVPSLAGAQVR